MSVLSELDAKHQLISVVCTSAVRCCRAGIGSTPQTTPGITGAPDFGATFVGGGASGGAAAGVGGAAAGAASSSAMSSDGGGAEGGAAGSPLGSPTPSAGSGSGSVGSGSSAFTHNDVLTEHLSLLK